MPFEFYYVKIHVFDYSTSSSIDKHPSIVKKSEGSKILSLNHSYSRMDQGSSAPTNHKEGENVSLESGEKESMIPKVRTG